MLAPTEYCEGGIHNREKGEDSRKKKKREQIPESKNQSRFYFDYSNVHLQLSTVGMATPNHYVQKVDTRKELSFPSSLVFLPGRN